MLTRASLLLLALLALGLSTALWALSPESTYPDAWYYRAVAREIVEGRGFTIPYLWNYVATGGGIDPSGTLPLAAFDHWMPLASLIAVPSLLLLGVGPLGYSLPFLLVAALLAPLTALLAVRLGASRRIALAAGLLAAVPGPFFWWATRSDNFALFALLGNLALWCWADARAGVHRRRRLFFGGLLLGVAVLSRTDALLLGLLLPWAAWPGTRINRLPAWIGGMLLGGIGALLPLAPWGLRQLAEFGSLFPSATSGRILWIRDYSELWGAGGPLRPDHLLGAEPLALLASRVDAFAYIFGIVGLYLGAILCLPFVIRGLRPLWRAGHPQVRLLGGAFLIHLAWSVLIAAPHVKTGNYIHGLMLYLPLAVIALLAGAEALAERIQTRGAGPLGGPSARVARTVVPLAMACWFGMSLLLNIGVLAPSAMRQEALGQTLAREIRALELSPDAVVAAIDPGMVSTLTGHPAILLPRSPDRIIDAALSAYRVTAVVIESRDLRGSDWATRKGAELRLGARFATPSGGEVSIYLLQP